MRYLPDPALLLLFQAIFLGRLFPALVGILNSSLESFASLFKRFPRLFRYGVGHPASLPSGGVTPVVVRLIAVRARAHAHQQNRYTTLEPRVSHTYPMLHPIELFRVEQIDYTDLLHIDQHRRSRRAV